VGACLVRVKTSCDEVIDPSWNPLTRPAPADEDAVAGPLPKGGEGWAFTQTFTVLRGPGCRGLHEGGFSPTGLGMEPDNLARVTHVLEGFRSGSQVVTSR
jgi:hypothetical protein